MSHKLVPIAFAIAILLLALAQYVEKPSRRTLSVAAAAGLAIFALAWVIFVG